MERWHSGVDAIDTDPDEAMTGLAEAEVQLTQFLAYGIRAVTRVTRRVMELAERDE